MVESAKIEFLSPLSPSFFLRAPFDDFLDSFDHTKTDASFFLREEIGKMLAVGIDGFGGCTHVA